MDTFPESGVVPLSGAKPAVVAAAPGSALATGVAAALAAGMLWGLVFLVPVMLHDYPPAVLSIGRYLAFGLICIPIAFARRTRLARLTRRDWYEAARLSLSGNFLYYGFLAAGIQLAGAPLPTILIGTLPVVIAVCSNLSERALPWGRLSVSLVTISAGVLLVNHDEWARLGDGDPVGLWSGAALTLVAIACWTWYPIRNSAWLRRNPTHGPGTWSTAQGLVSLPLALVGGAALWVLQAGGSGAYDGPLGPRPLLFVATMLVLGLLASWLGTILWNRASQLVSTSLVGQLIVFETLAALLYAFLWRGTFPGVATLSGVALLVAGVVLGVRAFQRQGRR